MVAIAREFIQQDIEFGALRNVLAHATDHFAAVDVVHHGVTNNQAARTATQELARYRWFREQWSRFLAIIPGQQPQIAICLLAQAGHNLTSSINTFVLDNHIVSAITTHLRPTIESLGS